MSYWPDPNDVAKQTEFAMFVGITQPAVAQMVKKGTLEKGQTYGEWFDAYITKIRDEAGGRNQDDRLINARIRESEMNGNLKELDYLANLKKVIWVEDLEPLMSEFISAIGFQVRSAEDRIIEGIESRYDIELDDDIIREPVRAALTSIAGSSRQLISSIDTSTDGAETPTTD